MYSDFCNEPRKLLVIITLVVCGITLAVVCGMKAFVAYHSDASQYTHIHTYIALS